MKGLIKSMSYADKYVTNQKNLSKISKESSITPINQTKKSIQFNNTDKIDTKTPSTSRNEKIFNKPITPKKGSTPLDTWSHSDLSQSEIGDQLDELNVSINLENLNINEPQHNNQKVEAQFKSNSNQAFRHPAFNPQFNSKLKSKSKKLGNETSQRHVNKESNPTVSETESKYGDLVKVKSLPQLPAAIVSNSPVIPDCPETSSSASNSYLSESSTSISDQSEKYQHQHQQQHQHQHQSPQFKHKSLNVELVETEIQKLEHEIGFNSVLNTTTDNKLVTNTINIESIQRDPKCQSNSNETKARRKVEYTPCSLEEYRLTKPREYVEITPKLRPGKYYDKHSFLLQKSFNNYS